MNSLMLKKVVVVSTGALIGAIVGYFVGGLIVYKLEMYEAAKKINDSLDGYNDFLDKIEKESEVLNQQIEGIETREVREMNQVREEIEKGFGIVVNEENKINATRKPKKVPYNNFSKKASSKGNLEELAKQYKTSIVPDVTDVPVDPNEPRIITNTEYESNELAHGQETLMYYELDDTLIQMDETLIDDPAKLLGPDALSNFGLTSGDSDIVYVRNPKNEMNYEVVRLHSSYQKEILGVDPEDNKKPKTKVKKSNGHREEEN